MKIKSILFLAALLVTATSYSQEKALKSITRDEAEKDMKYLSSDALEGRRTGSEGNNAAAALYKCCRIENGSQAPAGP